MSMSAADENIGLTLLANAASKTRTHPFFPHLPPLAMDVHLPATSPQPLDLSTQASAQCSVIKGPNYPEVTSSLPSSLFSLSSQIPTLLPQCANPNLNSNWIAMKFGAAVGPNRMSYPREFKLMVIDYYYANGANKYRTCKEFQITKSMLNGWLQKIDKIKQSRPGSLKSGRSGRRPQFPDIEKQLFTLYQNHLLCGQKVGNRWIRETARDLARKQCSEEQLGGMCQFSERWLSNFKKRYRINLNRDWSSGSSAASSTSSSVSSHPDGDDHGDGVSHSEEHSEEGQTTTSPTTHISGTDETDEHLDVEVDMESEGREATPTTPTDEESVPQHPLLITPTSLDVPLKEEPLDIQPQKPQVLPIHEFYRHYPWLCRRPTGLNYEPGRRGRKVQFPQVEKVLYQRLIQRQASGHRVSNRWLQEEARGLAAQLCPQVLAEATKSARCMFSEHWLHNFKKRYGVSLKQQLIANSLVKPPSSSVADFNPAITPTIPTTPTEKPHESLSPEPASLSLPHQQEASTPTTPTNPVAIAAFFQMQQWLLQQCYLQSLANRTAMAGSAFGGVGLGRELNNNHMGFPQQHPSTAVSVGASGNNNIGQTLLAAGVNLAEWYNKNGGNGAKEVGAEGVKEEAEQGL